jgi:signal transduction histidine kinase
VPEFQRIKGTGVGLYTTWRIIQLHRGVIRARSEPGQWAEFEFTIPVADG